MASKFIIRTLAASTFLLSAVTLAQQGTGGVSGVSGVSGGLGIDLSGGNVPGAGSGNKGGLNTSLENVFSGGESGQDANANCEKGQDCQ